MALRINISELRVMGEFHMSKDDDASLTYGGNSFLKPYSGSKSANLQGFCRKGVTAFSF